MCELLGFGVAYFLCCCLTCSQCFSPPVWFPSGGALDVGCCDFTNIFGVQEQHASIEVLRQHNYEEKTINSLKVGKRDGERQRETEREKMYPFLLNLFTLLPYSSTHPH